MERARDCGSRELDRRGRYKNSPGEFTEQAPDGTDKLKRCRHKQQDRRLKTTAKVVRPDFDQARPGGGIVTDRDRAWNFKATRYVA